jgi:sugar phosphate isomerase/epimerase
MAYSFSQALKTGALRLPTVVRQVREFGVREVELMDSLVPMNEVPAIQAALAETGIKVACYDVVCDVVTPDDAERQRRIAQLKPKLQQAARLGAKLIMVVPGLTREGITDTIARQWFSEALRQLVPEASRLGLTLMVENLGVMATFYGRSEHLNAICEAVGPELRVTYDVGNFLLAGEDALQAFDRLAPRIVHVHCKDWQVVPATTPQAYPGVDGRWFQGAALGEGVVNLRGAIARLRQHGYQGAVSVEYEGVGEPGEAVRRGVAYLRSLLTTSPKELRE